MAKLGRKILCDISDALIYSIQGQAVTFFPPNSSITFEPQYSGYDLSITVYKGKDVCFTFYVDEEGELLNGELWIGTRCHKANEEEISVLEDMFSHLVDEGVIKYGNK